MIKYYVDYEEVTEDALCEALEDQANEYAKEHVDEFIDECYPAVKVGKNTFDASDVIRNCDEYLYDQFIDDYANMLIEDAKYDISHTGSYKIGDVTYEMIDEEDEAM